MGNWVRVEAPPSLSSLVLLFVFVIAKVINPVTLESPPYQIKMTLCSQFFPFFDSPDCLNFSNLFSPFSNWWSSHKLLFQKQQKWIEMGRDRDFFKIEISSCCHLDSWKVGKTTPNNLYIITCSWKNILLEFMNIEIAVDNRPSDLLHYFHISIVLLKIANTYGSTLRLSMQRFFFYFL